MQAPSARRPDPQRAGAVWRRRAAAVTVVVGVLAAHGWVADEVAEHLADLDAESAMPARVEVAFVRDMAPGAPPAPAPAAAAGRAATTRPLRRTAGPAAAEAASAPAAEAEAEADTEPLPPGPAESEPVAGEPSPPLPAAGDPTPDASAAASEPPAIAASAVPGAAAFQWPASTRVSYVLSGNYRGEIHGDAQVDWVRVGDSRYQVHLDVTVGLPFAPLLKRRMSSDGELTPAGLAPERYDEDSKLAFRDRRRAHIRFEPGAIVLPDGRRRERADGVQDAASQFVQLTYLFTTRPELLAIGNTVELPLALPRSIDRWVYDVVAQETLDTPFGPVDTVHLVPRRAPRPGGDLTAEIWFAPALAYLPARIRIRQDADTYIDLVIRRRPQLAAP